MAEQVQMRKSMGFSIDWACSRHHHRGITAAIVDGIMSIMTGWKSSIYMCRALPEKGQAFGIYTSKVMPHQKAMWSDNEQYGEYC